MCDAVYKTLYSEAVGFLEKHNGQGLIRGLKVQVLMAATLNDVYRNLVNSLTSTKQLQKAAGPIDGMAKHLFDFDPLKTHACFGEDGETLKHRIQKMETLKTTDDAVSLDDHLEMFCQEALSGACFLTELGSLQDFQAFVNGFDHNEKSFAVLPLLLTKEVSFISFMGACQFLSQAGYPDYVHPHHTVKALLYDIGLIESKNNYATLKALYLIARANSTVIITVHDLLRLIAAEQLPHTGAKGVLRQAFIDHIIPIIK